MIASELIAECQEILVDVDGDTYTSVHGLRWVNDAQRAVALVKPEATSSYQSFQMVAGETRQILPDNTRRLLGVTRNMGIDGRTPGRPVRGPVRMESLDAVSPHWHMRPRVEIHEYGYLKEVEREFFVYPPPAVATYIEVVASLYPTDLTADTEEIQLRDIYIPPMREWMLYVFLARDNELSPNSQRAALHFQAFFNLLQIKLQSDMRVNPKRVERMMEVERAV